MLNKRTVDISTGIIFRTLLIIAGLWVLYFIRNIIALFFVSIIISAAIEPSVRWMVKIKLPRPLAVLLVFLVLFLAIAVSVSLLIPPIVSQFQSFTEDLPGYLEKLSQLFGGLEYYFSSYGLDFSSEKLFANISGWLSRSSGEIFSTTIGLFQGVVAVIAIFSMSFYMSVKEQWMEKFLELVSPPAHREYVISLATRMRDKIGRWLQGQLFLMMVIFALDYLALSLIGVPYALVLAIFAGLLEIIPYLGPIISAIPAVIVGFIFSPVKGLLVLAAYIIIQQFENHIITPQIMKKAVGLNPVVVILVLLIGAKLGGILGAVLAVPLAAAGSVLAKDLFSKGREQNTENGSP